MLVAGLVSIATAAARTSASMRLPVVALVVFKVRNIEGELGPCVGLVLAGTVSGSLLACGHGRQLCPQTWICITEDALELSLRSATAQLTAQCAHHDWYRIL